MIRTVQNSFVSGEISPQLYSRHDLKAYFNGAKRLPNFIVRKAGGLRKRSGSDLLLNLGEEPSVRLVPFFYDRSTCILLLLSGQKLYFIVRDAKGVYSLLKKYSGETGASSLEASVLDANLSVYSLTTQYADEDLPFLSYYQAGDTVFLTCRGYQACKVQRQTDLSWTLEYMTGTITVPTPATLQADPYGFHDVGTNYPASKVDYALFAVKGGVISAPKKASASITVPWIAGAQVAVSFTPDLSTGIDGYKIGKKSGSYYGLLAEILPTRTAVGLTGKTYSTSGVSALDWVSSWRASTNHASDLRESDPDAKTSAEIKMIVNRYAIHVPKASDGLARAEFYNSGGFTVGEVWICFGARTADSAKQNAVLADYSAPLPPVLIQKLSGSTWVTVWEGTAPSASPSGSAVFPVSDPASMTRLRVSVGLSSDADTGVVLRGIAVFNKNMDIVTGSWTLASSATAYSSRGVKGVTSSATYSSATYLDVTSESDLSNRTVLELESCTPSRYLKPHKTPVALALYDSGGGVMAGSVKLTDSSHFACTEIRIWPGALCAGLPLVTPGVLETQTSNTTSCKILYTLDGSSWAALAGTYVVANQYGTGPVSIEVPDTPGVSDAAVGWGVELIADDSSLPVLVRGVQFFETTVIDKFIDENHTPGELIDAQTYIKPGSSDMDVDTLGIWQQRMILGGSSGLPFTMWCSKAGDLSNWYANRPQTDDDAFSVSIPASRASRIKHIQDGRVLVVYTEGGVYVVSGSESAGFTYRTCTIKLASGIGACDVPPVELRSAYLFVAADGRTLTELRYDLAQDGFIPFDRSVASAHLTERSNIKRMAWQPSPDGTLWVLLEDGSMISFTYLPEHEVYAWSRHVFAGGTAEVIDIVAPGSVDETDPECEGSGDVYLLVRDSAGTVWLEKMRKPVSSDSPTVLSALCLDRMQTVTASSPASKLYPAHLYPEGDALVCVDISTGDVRTGTAESDGVSVSGDAVSGTWAIGYEITAELETLRPELPDRNIQGLRKNVLDTLLRVNRTRGLAVRAADGSVSASAPQSAVTGSGRVELFSGDVAVTPRGVWNNDGNMVVTCGGPWPAEILSAVFSIDLEAR